MGKALYRKYRSKSLAEIVGQEHITLALSRALEKGHISHAYLFTGPRGVGKTSIARIMAYEVNKLPYDESAQHLDIIEIDAASNRRIDEVRDLREKVHVAPTSARYKVYIIDEVHMLTREAFNALLKTLEEPPAHVLFILATTEAHKLPETIISRTQHFAFKPLDQGKVVAHLASIAKSEGISITDEALKLVALHGGGSFRDSISLLDQVKNYADTIDAGEVEQLLGIAPADSVESLVTALANHEANTIIAALKQLNEQGVEPSVLANQLSERLQNELLAQSAVLPKQDILALLSKLIEVPASAKPPLALEICLLEIIYSTEPIPALPRKPASKSAVPPKANNSGDRPKTLKTDKPEPPVELKTTKQQKHATDESIQPEAEQQGGGFSLENWPDILARVKKSNNTMYGVLRMAKPQYAEGVLTLEFKFPFHQKRASEAKNQTIIINAVKDVTGVVIKLSCVVIEHNQTPPPDNEPDNGGQPSPESEDSTSLATISNIFGGAELLES